jgi:hypothetical protein
MTPLSDGPQQPQNAQVSRHENTINWLPKDEFEPARKASLGKTSASRHAAGIAVACPFGRCLLFLWSFRSEAEESAVAVVFVFLF